MEIVNYPKNQQKGDCEISYHSVNLEIAVLHHFFNYCIKKGLIEKNPCSGIKKLNKLSRLKTLTDEDINKLCLLHNIIWECRIKYGSNIYRIFCFMFKNSNVVLTHGFIKKAQKTPKNEIEKAEKYKNDFIKRNGKNE